MAKSLNDAGEQLRKEAKAWLDRIDASTKSEKEWSDDADEAVAVYTGSRSKSASEDAIGAPMFNILFSNVETIVPATINSPPAPDIRRRFDSEDEVAQDYAEVLERAMRVQIDDGHLQTEMEAAAQDAFLAGRGIVRLRFKSDFEPDEFDEDELRESAEENPEDQDKIPEIQGAEPGERAVNERIEPEVVSWRDFRHGPAKRWADVPWIAFSHALAKDEYKSFCDGDMIRQQAQDGDNRRDEKPYEEIKVWEIWEKDSRTVIFIDEEKCRLIKRIPDPLGLTKFFPIHDPIQPVEVTGRLMPVNPYKIYRKLADELDKTTKRIAAITNQLRVKGWYAGSETDLNMLLEAGDNEFIPLQDESLWAAKGGIDGAIGFWPIEKLVAALRELYVLRDQTKASIYEITGISDIIRGASKSSETATAQQIKSQWGSLRIQKMQRQMERAGRDLFLMMAEIIPAKFSNETLQKMTGIQIVPNEQDMMPVQPPQPPMRQPNTPPEQMQAMQDQYQQAVQQAQQAEQARTQKLNKLMQLQALMQEKPGTYFRIDVESDSTIRADLTQQKQEASEFMSSASAYFTAVGPMIQQGMLPMELAVELFSGFTRLYNLGKTVDDALDTLIRQAKAATKQPQQQKPDPNQIKAETEAKIKAQEAQSKQQSHQLDMQMRQQKNASDLEASKIDHMGKQADLQIKKNQVAISNMDVALKQRQLALASNQMFAMEPQVT